MGVELSIQWAPGHTTTSKFIVRLYLVEEVFVCAQDHYYYVVVVVVVGSLSVCECSLVRAFTDCGLLFLVSLHCNFVNEYSAAAYRAMAR